MKLSKDAPIRSRGSEMVGKTTGTTRKCQLEGCSGHRYGVRWPTGKLTWPCGKGLLPDDDGVLRIQ
jgi:hypothetical protein